ncbi:MAG: response regulator [candidate division Zixibacteria bacterium]|nr:response regulator [candidate division Zixibacteria bacterium]
MTESTYTILIVDDEPNVIKSLRRLLIDTDYEILTAESGEAGLEILENNEVQLIISDYRMPGMSGIEFLAQARKIQKTAIRMILSGFADVSTVVEAINDGHVYKFIGKPWNDQDLLTTILRAFEQYELQRENKYLNEELLKRNILLQKTAQSLEEKVIERTRDLEIRNIALKTAHNILEWLPVGVIGIDNEETIVYANKLSAGLAGLDRVDLGVSAKLCFDKGILEDMMGTIHSGMTIHLNWDITQPVKITCSPIPEKRGVICVLQKATQEADLETNSASITCPPDRRGSEGN